MTGRLMRKGLAASMAAAMLLTAMAAGLGGCAGREANPVAQYQYGDEKKSCPHLRAEISELQAEMERKAQASENTQGKNVALGVTGAVLFWPALFFMDLSDADKVELEALRKRHNALVRICADKDCGFGYQEIAQIKPEQAEPPQRPEPELMQGGE
jgi:hypothetical protein